MGRVRKGENRERERGMVCESQPEICKKNFGFFTTAHGTNQKSINKKLSNILRELWSQGNHKTG